MHEGTALILDAVGFVIITLHLFVGFSEGGKRGNCFLDTYIP